MSAIALLLFASLAQSTEAASASQPQHNHTDMTAPSSPRLLDGYGTGGFAITTSNPQAAAYFSNGMQLAHAFAHEASVSAMREAVRLAPTCAMCAWGEAWASGPTINYGKDEAEVAALLEKSNKAAALAASNGTTLERELIAALQMRYDHGGGGKPGDLAFAKAMAALAERYPQNDEVAILAADAWLMAPSEGIRDDRLNAELSIALIERVLKRSPNDTGAAHFYIHATEIAGRPALAEPYANRLAGLAPKASHLVHMPSHTYYWVGRYQDAANTNMRAVEIGIAQAKALAVPPPNGVWGLPYHSHNVVFGLGGAMMADDAKTGLALGRPLVERSQDAKQAGPFQQLMGAAGYLSLSKFAPVSEVLALPAPKMPFMKTMWHYARGEAYARSGDVAGVRREYAGIQGAPGKPGDNEALALTQQMTLIARSVLNGRAAMLERRYGEAAAAFRQAAELQEDPKFSAVTDPPAWYYPVRRDLAAALLAAGDRMAARQEAEATLAYRKKDPAALALLSKLGSL
jgi:hypothetical protein